jgi:hypothetical protein
MTNRDLLRREPQRIAFRTEEGFQEAHAAQNASSWPPTGTWSRSGRSGNCE